MKIKQNDKPVRSFKSNAPDWLLPIYNKMQATFDVILNNPSYVTQLSKLQLKQRNNKGDLVKKANGTLWKEIKEIIDNPIPKDIPNRAWYLRILESNLIHLLRSRHDQVQIFNLLKKHNFKINTDLRNDLVAKHLYPTNALLNSLAKADNVPTLPQHATFKLDYAFSDKQMFTMDNNGKCLIHILSAKEAKQKKVDAWKEFQIYLPTYIRYNNLTKLCKPCFYYDKKTNKLISQISYECRPFVHPDFKNILGVDMGKVKLYSATILTPDGHVSDEFIPSKLLSALNDKLGKINQHKNNVYDRLKRIKAYLPKGSEWSEPYQTYLDRVYEDYQNNREKIARIKEQAEWLTANELITLALRYKCKEIHMENLTWVANRGGKWDFSKVIKHVNYLAELNGIKLILVNAKNTSKEHPVTAELGKPSKRNIKFKDISVDRDQLGGENIALRNTDIKVKQLKRRQVQHTKRQSNRKRNKLFKQNVLKQIKDTQIVMFLPMKVNNSPAIDNTALRKLERNLSNLSLLKTKVLSISKYTAFN